MMRVMDTMLALPGDPCEQEGARNVASFANAHGGLGSEKCKYYTYNAVRIQ